MTSTYEPTVWARNKSALVLLSTTVQNNPFKMYVNCKKSDMDAKNNVFLILEIQERFIYISHLYSSDTAALIELEAAGDFINFTPVNSFWLS